MKVVLDANVVVAGVCWLGEGWLCLIRLAERRAFAYGTLETAVETREATLHAIEKVRPKHNAAVRLTWYLEALRLVDPIPVGKQRSRDAKDDPYIAAALTVSGAAIVTYDRDLLSLGKPFGIEIISPAQFLKRT